MKKYGFILAGVGLAMVMSCSKEHLDGDTGADLYSGEVSQITNQRAAAGTYEGEWRLSKYGMTCTGQIEVSSYMMISFDVPADYLVPRLALYDETKKAAYPGEPLFMDNAQREYFSTSQVMRTMTQGYSTDAAYSQLANIAAESSDTPSPPGDFALQLGVKTDGVDYVIRMTGIKEQPSAVYDVNTGLWTMAIPIDQVTVTNLNTGAQMSFAYLDEEAPEKSAWLLVFRATRKIK